jgi:tryptophan synthase beta chain
MGERVKFELAEEQIPSSWVNLLADLPGEPPPPPLSPATGEPVGPEDLSAIFPMG